MKKREGITKTIIRWLKHFDASSKVRIKVGGVSLKGQYHDVNQDAYCCVSSPEGQVIVLSDGVGSCEMSHFGSHALCEAVVEEAFEVLCDVDEPKEFLQRVHARWLRKLFGMHVSDCCCTALFVIVKNKHFTAFQLGDGVVVVRADDTNTVLIEEKDEGFRNYTDAMDEKLYPDLWRISSRDFEIFQGVYLSSDGVGLDQYTEARYADFAEGFFSEYQSYTADDVEQVIGAWLKDWDGSDDKTIAFALKDEAENDGQKDD